jgi:ribosomal protein S30
MWSPANLPRVPRLSRVLSYDFGLSRLCWNQCPACLGITVQLRLESASSLCRNSQHSAMKQTWKSCSSTPRLSARTNTRLAPRNENAVLCIDRVVKLSGHRFKIVVVFYTRSPRTAPSQSPSHPQVKIANKLRGRPLGCATCTKALARPRAWNRIVRLR